MFTGLIEAMGTIERVTATPAGREFRVSAPWDDLSPGDSVALNGACLTVRDTGPRWFTVAAITTTLERTTMGAWTGGGRVNLERAVRMGDRLGGHLVQGHVDGVGTVRAVGRGARRRGAAARGRGADGAPRVALPGRRESDRERPPGARGGTGRAHTLDRGAHHVRPRAARRRAARRGRRDRQVRPGPDGALAPGAGRRVGAGAAAHRVRRWLWPPASR
jgi:hypothetical protein